MCSCAASGTRPVSSKTSASNAASRCLSATISKRRLETLTKESLKTRESSLWRYREVLPVENAENTVSLGEGWTPLFKTDKLAASLPVKLNLFIKDEGQNPTQSVQGTRNDRRDLDGKRTWRQKACRAVRR